MFGFKIIKETELEYTIEKIKHLEQKADLAVDIIRKNTGKGFLDVEDMLTAHMKTKSPAVQEVLEDQLRNNIGFK